MVMFFFDELGDLEEYQLFRKLDQPLEKDHLTLRKALQEAEAILQMNPQDQEAGDKVKELQQALADLELRAPWINADYPIEYLLWGPPHG